MRAPAATGVYSCMGGRWAGHLAVVVVAVNFTMVSHSGRGAQAADAPTDANAVIGPTGSTHVVTAFHMQIWETASRCSCCCCWLRVQHFAP